MLGFLNKFERIIIHCLIVMMVLVVSLSAIELAWIIIVDITTPPYMMLEINQLLELFGVFLLVLIGFELLDTIRAYLVEKVIHMEIVLEVSLLALARKVIILDLEKYDGATVLALAALILAVAAAFFAVKRRGLTTQLFNKKEEK